MPSGLENLEGNKFILRYEHPWGGIASNAAPEDIAPNQFVECDGLFIKNGKLCSTNFYVFDPIYYTFTNFWSGNPLYMQTPIQNPGNPSQTNDIIVATYIQNGNLIAIDGRCNVYKYDWNSKSFGQPVYAPPGYSYSCSQMIRGVIYMFDWWSGQQIVYDNGQIYPGTSFVGGKYCMTIDQYLIVCNTDMQVWGNSNCSATPPVQPSFTGTRERRANRYNWSAANEGYTTFNPAVGCDPNNPVTDPTTGLPNDRTAGWNGIPDVQQEITGCFAMGNVGYILHDTGVTQLTPTSSAILGETAIQPFDTTLLWGGKDGMGCTMPQSLAVYGHFAIWGNAGGFYLFSGAGAPQDITGLAKASIFADINKYKHGDNRWLTIAGQICNTGVDCNNPELVYNLYIVTASPAYSQPINMVVWTYVFGSQAWTRHVVNVSEVTKTITGDPNYDGVLIGEFNVVRSDTFKFPENYDNQGAFFFESPLYGGILFNLRRVSAPVFNLINTFFLCQYINDGITSIADAPPVTNLMLRSEEFQIYREPTIRGFIIRAAGQGTLHISVNGSNFTDIVLNGDVTKTYLYRSFGMWTGMAPAINITSTDFNGYITKIHAFGTYAEGEPI